MRFSDDDDDALGRVDESWVAQSLASLLIDKQRLSLPELAEVSEGASSPFRILSKVDTEACSTLRLGARR